MSRTVGVWGPLVGVPLLSMALGCDELGQMAQDEWDQRGKPPKAASSDPGGPPRVATVPSPALGSSSVPTARPVAAPLRPSAPAGHGDGQSPVRPGSPTGSVEEASPPRAMTRLATWEGGCGLVGSSNGKVYARATDCKHLLELDPESGKLTSRLLPKAMLVRAVDGGGVYGCELGYDQACRLLRAPLDGGAAVFVAEVKDAVDGSGQVFDGAIVFRRVDREALRRGVSEGAIVRLELATGKQTEVAARVGVGQVELGPGVTLFEGALDPAHNVGSPSWGLWAYRGGAPTRLGVVTADDLAADGQNVYYTTADHRLHRWALDGSSQGTVAEFSAPVRLEGRLGVSSALALTASHVFVSAANAERCEIFRTAK